MCIYFRDVASTYTGDKYKKLALKPWSYPRYEKARVTTTSRKSGIPIRTTLDNSTTVQYAGLLHQLTMKARSTVRDIDPQNDLTFLRIRSKKHEIMVAPDKEYLLIVIQNPCE
ncbi:dynein light chain roadblock-type 2 isoform X1 [Chelonia mydas]|uniref:dynein light chain roadblock-type 2 isoform X1 n=1 Tax=Chelonia mydas TaxID=8469 RepID=UPI000FFC7F48|nr:dynein light chain roadblock-type 2 isoform X1 [Chelonia mydas]XP_043381879.1 dynein light chain roadblock-type 2 isoform X1 [Chelonia mydas]